MNHNCLAAAGAALLGTCLISFSSAAALAGEPAGSPATAKGEQTAVDLAAIRAEAQAFVDAFNRRDAKAVAALWTEDGEYVDDTGQKFVGRAAIAQSYADLFAGPDVGSIRIVIDSLRLLSADTALEDGRAFREPAPFGAPGIGKYTVVHVKRDGKWFMASVRDTRVETPSTHRNFADLEWLIGTWVAEEQGCRNESVCRWIGNKSFVERTYTLTDVDGTVTTGVQLIGWNPQQGQVQSWDFSPDGGHAVGTWSPQPGGWTAEVQGVTGDGTPTASINRLTRLDDNAYVWQSVQRMAAGLALPDTDEVVLKRQPVAR